MTQPYLRDPQEIYQRSFEIIEEEADFSRFPQDMKPLLIRLIHASGMVDLLEDVAFHPWVGDAGRRALISGAPILCDSSMVAEGVIPRRLPAKNQVKCLIGDVSVAEHARQEGITRSMAAVESWQLDIPGAVVAIGNAPTALFRLLELLGEGLAPPAVILGFPVGFVGASESKELLETQCRNSVPFITVHGRRGGSAMASAAVNALAQEGL